MKSAIFSTALGALVLAMVLVANVAAQQGTTDIQGNAGQASQPAANPGPGRMPAAGTPLAPTASRANSTIPEPEAVQPSSKTAATSSDDNPYDPILEPPPLPKGKPTLIGGIATHVDHVRNRLTIRPFGGSHKVKLFVDERSHVYRNGRETTVLGIHQGDRVYADTMLDGSKVFAKNVRVLTETGLAEVRGQVIGRNPEKGTIRVQDQLSARPVTFAVNAATRYSSSKGPATEADLQPGSLVDVQFSANQRNGDVAQEITVLAKPGDNYIFSGAVIGLDMRSNTLMLENSSDDQTYEVHFSPLALSDPHALKVGQEVTARATFDGKQYKATNIRIEDAKSEGEQSKAQ